ncbi:hypothetical protein SLS62_005917 [Diatrype stigma]|uniref:Uncharacterized protein n=1 Tax=Diatrype stigma TaxID=117547 RepID=A0AAN9UQS9_9PEZI
MCEYCLNGGARTSRWYNLTNQDCDHGRDDILNEPNHQEHSTISVAAPTNNDPLLNMDPPMYRQGFGQSTEFVGPNVDFILFDDDDNTDDSGGGEQATPGLRGQTTLPMFPPCSTSSSWLPQPQANQFSYDILEPLAAPSINTGIDLTGRSLPMLSSYNNAAETEGMLDLLGNNTMPLERTTAYDEVRPMIFPPPFFTGSRGQATHAGIESGVYPDTPAHTLVHPPIWNGGDISGGAYDELLPLPPLSTGYPGQLSQAGAPSDIWPEAGVQTPGHPYTTAWDGQGMAGRLDWTTAASFVPSSDYHGQSWVPYTPEMPNNDLQHRTEMHYGVMTRHGNQGRRLRSELTATGRHRAIREERRNEILGRRHRRTIIPDPVPGDEQAALGLMELSCDSGSLGQ